MVKFGRCVDCKHHQYYAHTIHPAVCDVLYKKTFTKTDVTEAKTSADSDAEELEEDDCRETKDLKSGINMVMVKNKLQVTLRAIWFQMQLM